MAIRRDWGGVWFLMILGCSLVFPAAIAKAGNTAKEELTNLTQKQFILLQNQARHGDPGAQAALAVAYEEGIHVQQDLTEAIRWYRKAALRDNAEVQHHLGLLYEQGRGVVQSFVQAAEWYQKAAALGYVPAQCNLANLYQAGKGLPRDLEQAAKWYEVAARQGNAQAQSNLGYVYQYGQGVVRDQQQAVFWYTQGSRAGLQLLRKPISARCTC